MRNLFTILLCTVIFFLVLSGNYLLGQWIQTNGPVGGGVNSLTVSGPNIIAAVGEGQGVFLSSDNGKSWRKIKSGFPEYNNVSLVVAIGSKTFAGTGDGLYISSDYGINWKHLNSGPAYARAIVSLPERLIVSGDNGLFYSADGGENWLELPMIPGAKSAPYAFAVIDSIILAGTDDHPENSGIYFSADGGFSWAPVKNGPSSKMVTSFALSDSNIFAGTGSGVFLSTDKGASWKNASTGLTNSHVISLAVNGNHIFAGTMDGVFLSTDNGLSWIRAGSGIPDYSEVKAFAVNGADVFTGTNYLPGIDGGGVYLSTDNGANWRTSNNGLTNTTITSLAANGSNIFAGTSTGLFGSGDQGKSWEALKNGLGNNIINSIAVSGAYILAATDSNGVYRSNDNGASWKKANNGLTSTTVVSLFVNGTNIFAGAKNGIGVFRSTNDGESWVQVNNGLPSLWITSFAANDKYIFAGDYSGVVFRSSDSGENWTLVKNGLTYRRLSSLAAMGNVIFAGYEMDGIFRSTDNGDSWQQMHGEFVLSLAVSGNNLFIGSWETGVVLSEDSAATIKTVGTGFPDLSVFPVFSLAVSGTELYAGSQRYGVWKRPLSEMITQIPPPGIPQLNSVKNNSKDQPLDLTLKWSKSSAADSYFLMVASDSLFNAIVLSDSALTDTTKEVGDLKEGQKYYWKVSSKNTMGISPFSEVWNFTTMLYPPESLGASVRDNKEIKLTWKDNSENEEGYIIERKQDADFIPVDTVKADVTDYTDSISANLVTYYYRVKAYTPFAVSEYSNTASVTLTGVDKLAFIPREFRLFQNYPNPFNPATIIRYWLPRRTLVEIRIFDMLGREILTLINGEREAGEYKIRFDSSRLPSGVYIYLIKAGEFRDSKKFILLK
ncbi:MAG: T9SS type A sorting domain-containing protein [Acidobacteriota bacterium]